MTDSLNNQRLVALARAMYGERWQNALARDLGVSQPQCWRWAKGHQEPTDQRVYEVEELFRRWLKSVNDLAKVGKN